MQNDKYLTILTYPILSLSDGETICEHDLFQFYFHDSVEFVSLFCPYAACLPWEEIVSRDCRRPGSCAHSPVILFK